MSHSFDDKVKLLNVPSIWLVRIYENSDGSTVDDSIQIGTSAYSNAEGYWHPIIQNRPSLRTSINLRDGVAKTSSITLKCLNDYSSGQKFSELFFGSNNYINKPVKIWQKFSDTLTPSGVVIFTGRLVDVSHDIEFCTLKLQSARAWDHISIPNEKTDIGNKYIPVVYGAFTPNNPDSGFYTHGHSGMFPCPIIGKTRQAITSVTPMAYNKTNCENSTAQAIHLGGAIYGTIVSDITTYDYAGRKELTSTNFDTSGANTITTPITSKNISQLSRLRNNAINFFSSQLNEVAGADEVVDSENAFEMDGESATSGAYATASMLSTGSETSNMKWIGFKAPVNEQFGYMLLDEFTINCYATAGSNISVKITNENTSDYWSGSFTTSTGTFTITGDFDNFTDVNTKKINNAFTLKIWRTGGVATSIRIYSINLRYDCRYGYVDDTDSKISTSAIGELITEDNAKGVEKLEYLYCGGVGALRSGTATTNWKVPSSPPTQAEFDIFDLTHNSVAGRIHEAHRDILNRFCDVKIENNTDETNSGWNDLNTSRTNWGVRYFLLEPTPLKDVLEKLQYEGGFVYTLGSDGKGRYISVKSSYSGGDVDHTLGDSHLKNINITHSPFSEIMTKMVINSQYDHPTKSYIQTKEFNSDDKVAGTRAKYNIQTKENVEKVDLDALFSTNMVSGINYTTTNPRNGTYFYCDGFWDYYYNIFGDIKLIIEAEIVSPDKWGIEVGDICTFADIELKAYNTDLGASDYFMITDITRTLDSVKFKAREVG